MTRIFIGYRRSISRCAAGMLHQFCVKRFGAGSVFLDTDSIQAGQPFPERIVEALESCEVFLPLIGAKWHEAADENGLRLHQPDDWVRLEIETVFRRNELAAGNGQNPILIIPMIEAGASLPPASELPDELRPLRDLNSVNYTNLRDLEFIAPVIDEHLGSPPMGEFGLKALAQRPDLSRRDRHRFRYVRNPGDMDPFVTLSDGEAVIAGANPDLYGKSREELYDRWAQSTARDGCISWHDPANQVQSFLILDQRQDDESWLPIGVSILLPLTLDGARHLRLIRKGDAPVLAKRNAATLASEDLARGRSNRLLLDTWIIRRRPAEDGKPPRRIQHYNWGFGLVLRHIAEFWDSSSPDAFTFLCEPDNPKIAAMLNDLRFYEENRNTVSGNLFVLKYPLDEDKYGPEDVEGFERIKQNIQAIREVPIGTGQQ